MPFGENVGTAYVRILADGDGLDESIRKQFQDADGAFDESGRRGSDRYAKSFEKEMKRSPNEKRLQNSITDALAKGDFLSKGFLHGPAWQSFKDDLEREFGDAGRLAGERLERDLTQGMTFDQLKSKLQNIQPLITKAQDDILKNDRNFIRDRNAAYEEHRRRMAKIVDGLNKEFEQVSKNIDLFRAGDRGAPSREHLINDLQRIGREMHSAGGHTDEFARSLKNQEDRLRRVHPRLQAFDNAVGRFAGGLGRLFGKGSRNDFVNFIGSFVGGIAGAIRVIPRAITAFADLGSGIRQAMQDAASEGAGGLRVAMAGVTASLESGGTALVAFAAAAVGAMFLIGPVVALLSSLVGILAALAGTVLFGAIGGLAALAGAAVPLVGIIGGLVFAFRGLSDAQKAIVKEAIKPLKTELSGLAGALRRPIISGLAQQIRTVTPALTGLKPLFHDIGQAISDVGTHFADAIASPGFKNFRDAMERFLPNAIRSLGTSIGNSLGGLAGVFTAIIPLTQRFLGWLKGITGEFANWANSRSGHKELLDFFGRAGDSAKSLGDFIVAASGFLGQLLSQGQSTGDNIFDRMTASIKTATQWLKDNPDAVSQWFGNAEKVAGDIGSIITGLTELVDAFDNADTRIAGDIALRTFVEALDGLALVVQADAILIGGTLKGLGAAAHAGFSGLTFVIEHIMDLFGKLKGFFVVPDHVGGGKALIADFTGIGFKILGVFRGLPGKIGSILGRIPGVARGIGTAVAAPFRSIPGKIASALGGLAGRVRGVFNRLPGVARAVIGGLTRPFAPVTGRIAGLVNSLPGRMRGIFNRLPGIARSVISGITRPFSPVTGRIMGFINGLPGRVRGLVNRLPGIARSAANSTASQFRSVPGRIMGLLNGIPGRVSGLLGRLGGIASRAASATVRGFSGVTGRIASQFSGVGGAVAGRLSGIAGAARSAASAAVGAFRGLAGRIIGAVGTIHLPTPTISMPHIPRIHIPGTAVGGVFEGLRGVGVVRQIGEAGPEAVVPLNRSLSQVDPSVRALSAIAQGLSVPGMASGGVVGGGKTVDVGGINVYTVTQDPRAVAAEVFNRFAAMAY